MSANVNNSASPIGLVASNSADQPAEFDEPKTGTRVRRLLGYTWPYRIRLILALVSLLGGTLLGLVYPQYFGEIIDAAFIHDDISSLNRYTVVLIIIFAVQAVFVFFRHYLFSWVGERVVADLRVELYTHLVRLSQAYFHRKRTGALLSRLAEDISKIHNTVASDISVASRNVVTLVGGIAIMFWSNAYLTCMMLAVVPPLTLATAIFGRRIRVLARRVQDQLATANAQLQEGIAGIETVQAFTREDHEVERYSSAIGSAFDLFIRKVVANSWFMSVASFTAFTAIAGIFWMGGTMVANGEISPGELSGFMIYTMMVASAVGLLASTWSNVQTAIGASARVFEILDTDPELKSRPDAIQLDTVRGELRFDKVSFAYSDRDGDVVSDINLHVSPGQSCALVGSSGSGKTTLSRLVLRFYDPQRGQVTIDGHDLRDLDLHSLRGQMAVVSQEPLLFSGTITENIRYGRLSASDEEVREAARLANAHDFIMGFPQGYETRVGERGVQLSGGQRQRVSIARAILRDPRILVLDEATSALDAHSEGIVQQALDNLQRGRTTLIIAHRLSTIRNADRIIVLEEGRIVEEGNHGELLSRGGVYARLVERQTDSPDTGLQSIE
ncbi:MAG: ABC transporter transmembrane domain-containing protein [Myxococcota bacterium]